LLFRILLLALMRHLPHVQLSQATISSVGLPPSHNHSLFTGSVSQATIKRLLFCILVQLSLLFHSFVTMNLFNASLY